MSPVDKIKMEMFYYWRERRQTKKCVNEVYLARRHIVSSRQTHVGTTTGSLPVSCCCLFFNQFPASIWAVCAQVNCLPSSTFVRVLPFITIIAHHTKRLLILFGNLHFCCRFNGNACIFTMSYTLHSQVESEQIIFWTPFTKFAFFPFACST